MKISQLWGATEIILHKADTFSFLPRFSAEVAKVELKLV